MQSTTIAAHGAMRALARLDARWFQIVFLVSLLAFGAVARDFSITPLQLFLTFAGALVTQNSISGAWQTGGNGLVHGIALRYCADGNASNNMIAFATSGSFDISDCTGIQK